MKPIFFSYPGNELLTSKLVQIEGGEQGDYELRNFPDGESYLRMYSDVQNRRTVIVCSLNQPDDKLFRLFLLAKTLKSSGASDIILIAPYLAYMRQDKAFQSGEGISSVYLAEFLSTFINKLITIDPHLHRIEKLSDIYPIQTQVAHSARLIAQWIKVNVSNALLIGPDSESEQWVMEVAKESGSAYTILEKLRTGDKEVNVSVPQVKSYMNHTPVLVDDIVSTGNTMRETLLHLKRLGMKPAVCIVIHPVFAGNAYQELQAAGASAIISCNTIEHSSNRIDISSILKL